ncbi:CLUMA_CG009993, isoform A [Clunio marinus]|uniref:CLUMA_CG009993, isoform A n=1 Tax=Clunio marinus TaxID=568069 RepID=A0A1J1I9K6_9DIPT|nr:CLUMA_CG009993, isoform A [Clunio marinus]
MFLKTVVILFYVKFCFGYTRDVNLEINENETIVDLLTRSMEITDYIVPEIDGEDFINILSPKIMELQPPFDLSSYNVSLKCQQSSEEFMIALNKFELWALRMYDASAKLTSGILNGNVNQFGDFDQCLETIIEKKSFQAQYCLAYIQPSVSSNFKYLNYLRTLALSFEAYKSKFEDPSHVVPKTSQIQWAFCIPSTCTHEELQHVLQQKLKTFINSSMINFDVEVKKEMCQIREESKKYDLGTKLALYFVAFVALIALLSTFYETYSASESQNEWLTAFSLKKNLKDMMSIEVPKGDIASPHGVRFFSMIMLILSHRSMEVEFNPVANRTQMSLMIKSPFSVLLRSSSLYTDTFLMLSGMLVAYSFIGRLQRGQNINVLKEIAARYFRVVPPMAALLLFGTFILPLLGDGPQWNMLITNQSEICKQTWWRNFLMIHNWFGFENICMTHTHHVGTDFSLFLIAPFMIMCLHKYPKKSMSVIFILALISTIGRFYITYARDMTVYVLFGIEYG